MPARQARLALYPEAWLLFQIKEAPEAELLERCDLEHAPRTPQPKATRRGAAPGGAATGAGRGGRKENLGGEG